MFNIVMPSLSFSTWSSHPHYLQHGYITLIIFNMVTSSSSSSPSSLTALVSRRSGDHDHGVHHVPSCAHLQRRYVIFILFSIVMSSSSSSLTALIFRKSGDHDHGVHPVPFCAHLHHLQRRHVIFILFNIVILTIISHDSGFPQVW